MMRILFVCGGNTCHSAMAAAISNKILGDYFQAESTGIFPGGKSATQKAIDIMHNIFGIDISGHRPRDVAELLLAEYNHIFALDNYVADHLSKYPQIKVDKLTVWNIKDPFIEGTAEAYECCARELESGYRVL